MTRHFICLANSKKLGGRCIAGIEITFDKENKKYILLQKDGKPCWVRPVSNTAHGEVATTLVGSIQINDIVELDITANKPEGHQCENVLFDPKTLKKVGRITVSEKSIDKFIESNTSKLFGNRGAAVHPDSIGDVDCSILLIKVDEPTVYNKKSAYDDKSHSHMKFVYEEHEYDLAITDLEFIQKYNADKTILDNKTAFYLTISLGVPFNDWYHKLVAGVIII